MEWKLRESSVWNFTSWSFVLAMSRRPNVLISYIINLTELFDHVEIILSGVFRGYGVVNTECQCSVNSGRQFIVRVFYAGWSREPYQRFEESLWIKSAQGQSILCLQSRPGRAKGRLYVKPATLYCSRYFRLVWVYITQLIVTTLFQLSLAFSPVRAPGWKLESIDPLRFLAG